MIITNGKSMINKSLYLFPILLFFQSCVAPPVENPMPMPTSTAPAPSGPTQTPLPTPSPGGPVSSPSPLPVFQLNPTSACYGEEIQISGQNYSHTSELPRPNRILVFRERSEDENSTQYNSIRLVVPDDNGNIGATFTLGKQYPSPFDDGPLNTLEPGEYMALLLDQRNHWTNTVNFEVKNCES